MRLIADNKACAANGLCAAVDEELFQLDDDGYISLGDGVDVPPEKAEVAKEGVDSCPVYALRLE